MFGADSIKESATSKSHIPFASFAKAYITLCDFLSACTHTLPRWWSSVNWTCSTWDQNSIFCSWSGALQAHCRIVSSAGICTHSSMAVTIVMTETFDMLENHSCHRAEWSRHVSCMGSSNNMPCRPFWNDNMSALKNCALPWPPT